MLTKSRAAALATILGAFAAAVVAILVAIEPYVHRMCAQASAQ